jgi:hypothetical protein
MTRTLLAGIVGLGLVACASAAARDPDTRDADRLQLGSRALDRTLVVGTLIEATIQDSPSWRRRRPGETLIAAVNADVRNAHRWVVIPAGSPVALTIGRRGVALDQSWADEAKIALDVTSVTVRDRMYPVRSTVELTRAVHRATDNLVVAGAWILFGLPEGFTAERPTGGLP